MLGSRGAEGLKDSLKLGGGLGSPGMRRDSI